MLPLPHEIIINILKNTVKYLFLSSNTQMSSFPRDIPHEIMINILKRLPIKSLLRLQSVCKDWRDLFKSPLFIQEHSAHNNPLLICYTPNLTSKGGYSRLALLRYDHKMEAVEVERIPSMVNSFKKILLYNKKETVKVERLPTIIDPLMCIGGIIGSCNGLLCMILQNPFSLFLLNPATKELRQVSISAKDNFMYNSSFWGFGHSSTVLDYKIVSIYPIYGTLNKDYYYVKLVKVFPLRTWSWKEVELRVLKSIAIQYKHVTVDGAMFWLGWSNEFGDGMVISFDLAAEVFTSIPMPSSAVNIRASMLDVYKNKVAMLHGYMLHEYESAFIDLWVLEEGSGAYGKRCWSKKYSVRKPSPSFYPKCLWRDEMVFYKINDDSGSFFILTANNELKKLHCSLSLLEIDTSFSCVESLASICPTPMLNNLTMKMPLSLYFRDICSVE